MMPLEWRDAGGRYVYRMSQDLLLGLQQHPMLFADFASTLEFCYILFIDYLDFVSDFPENIKLKNCRKYPF